MIESRETAAAPTTAPPTAHRFLARTFTAARWSEYEALLGAALEEGWVPMSLEQWIVADGVQDRVLILRHDVDQHPATALRMARLEAAFGVRATWYFRWRTCSTRVIDAVRDLGGTVGFHYETLTRLALERHLDAGEINDELIDTAREELAVEVSTFAARFGPVRSICAHGDTRLPGVSNQILVRGQEPRRFGVEFDANEALSRHTLGLWMTDRTSTDGRWKDGIDPSTVLQLERRPVLCLTHPNNWCSGLSLWADRLSAAVLPDPQFGRTEARLGVRTRSDQPPSGHVPNRCPKPAASQGALVAPNAAAALETSLSREVLRHHYDSGERFQRDPSAGHRLSACRAALAEVLERAEIASLSGRDVLELGCGFGELALWLGQAGARVTAVESSPPRLAVGSKVAAEQCLVIDWVLAAAADWQPGDEERFDLVFLSGDWLRGAGWRSQRKVFRGAYASLRSGGMLAIREPASGRLSIPRYAMTNIALRRSGFETVGAPLRGQAPGAGAVLTALRPPRSRESR